MPHPNQATTNSQRTDNGRLFEEPTARRLLILVFAFLVVVQGLYLLQIGPGVGKLSDGFSEANAIRAAEAYLKDGIASYHGLPRQAFGKRFPNEGFRSVILESDGSIRADMRRALPPSYADADKWVYTHYPEGPDVLLALMGRVAGLDHPRLLRLLPLGLCLAATAFFFFTLAQAFGTDRAALIAAACVVLPMFNTYMPGLHFQGYSFALFLLQISLLIRHYWLQAKTPIWSCPVLFLLGFLQGWLSFDVFFIVALIAVPLWLARMAEGRAPSKSSLVFAVLFPSAGFALAHSLHLLQVSGEVGGLAAAIAEFRTTAVERAGDSGGVVPAMLQRPIFQSWLSDTGHFAYLRSLTLASYQYIRDFLCPPNLQFFPFLLIAFIVGLPVILARSVRLPLPKITKSQPVGVALSWPEPGSFLPTLIAAFLVSSLWLFVMPAHSIGNHHITVRHFFVFYFFLVLVIAKSVRFQRR